MLHVSGVTKRFDNKLYHHVNGQGDFPCSSSCTIFDFSFSVPENGFTVFLGPSGCGKTTLFNILTGVVKADKGKIQWQGQSLPHLGKVAAYMQQKDLLLPWFSLMDNALLPVRVIGKDVKAAEKKAFHLFERLGLGGYEHHKPHEVSGGMGQRCALVRTLMFDRDLVFLDEPLSALDAITRQSLQSLLLLLQTEFGKTLVMVTHDIEEALLLADELFLVSAQPMSVQARFIPETPKPRRFNDPEMISLKARVFELLAGGSHEPLL